MDEGRKEVLFGASLISFAAILWGFDGVFLTPRLGGLDVFFIVLMIHLIPFVLMNAFFFKKYRHIKELGKREAFALLGVAVFGGALGTIAIVKALILVHFDGLSVVILLQKLQPIFAIALAYFLLHEKVGARFLEWAGVALVASYFLAFGTALPNFDGSTEHLYAAIWAVVAAFSFGSSTVFSKMMLEKVDFKTATFYRYGLTTLIMAVVVTLFGKWSWINSVSEVQWIVFFVIAFTTGSGAIFIYYYGLRKVRAVISTICELFLPISSVVFEYAFYGNTLTLFQSVSAIVLLFAIVKINLENAKVSKS